MTLSESRHRLQEIALAKAKLVAEQAATEYGRCVDLQSRMAGAIAAKDVEAAKLAYDLATLDIEAAEVRLESPDPAEELARALRALVG